MAPQGPGGCIKCKNEVRGKTIIIQDTRDLETPNLNHMHDINPVHVHGKGSRLIKFVQKMDFFGTVTV